jgi:hypothetical protein
MGRSSVAMALLNTVVQYSVRIGSKAENRKREGASARNTARCTWSSEKISSAKAGVSIN